MTQGIRRLVRSVLLLFNRVRFHLFFPKVLAAGRYGNSKLISVSKGLSLGSPARTFLVFIRSGGECRLIDDGDRNFDIALNLYACANNESLTRCEYLIAGGLNKYKAAFQFLDSVVLGRYQGIMFLDDDLEMTCSELSRFLTFCRQSDLQLAQPSLSHDSYYSHGHLLNVRGARIRRVHFVEVMCPYFSAEALKKACFTFDLSYSTWGLDYLWPKLPGIEPVVVDAFTIRHTRPRDAKGAFYRYMRRIGVSPWHEETRLRRIALSARPADKPTWASDLGIGRNAGTGKDL
ncbi:MAG TPA: hypothetical protein VMR74_07035 [Gammaproteobacteria bacterium]|nr:hypothetical protein [Gammaproteobacteria bacterium]